MNIFKSTVRVILFSVMALALSGPAFAEITADQIMKEHYALKQADQMESTMVMALREKNGTKNTRVLKAYSMKTEKGTNNFTEFLSPADVKGTKFLTLGSKTGNDEQRLWLPALKKVRLIASSGKSGKFMGSDLCYYDMENRDFNDGQYKLLGEDKIVSKKNGTKTEVVCWIIEVIPTDPDAPYSKTHVWVSKEDYFIYKSQMYDKKGEQEKTISILEVTVIDDIIMSTKMLVDNINGHKTLMLIKDIKINQGIDPSIFTIQNLQK